MTRTFAGAIAEVDWWPTPTHYAVISMAASQTAARPRTFGDVAGGKQPVYRVQTTQGEIAERLSISSRTVSRCFGDFEAIGVMHSAARGRRWYIDGRASNVDMLSLRLRKVWPTHAARNARTSEADPAWEAASGEELADEPHDLIRRPRPLDAILFPEGPPSVAIRLESAVTALASSRNTLPAAVAQWINRNYGGMIELAHYLEGTQYQTLAEWMDAEYAEHAAV